jgi:hypothetical protein
LRNLVCGRCLGNISRAYGDHDHNYRSAARPGCF